MTSLSSLASQPLSERGCVIEIIPVYGAAFSYQKIVPMASGACRCVPTLPKTLCAGTAQGSEPSVVNDLTGVTILVTSL
jgi:hypothetical protein